MATATAMATEIAQVTAKPLFLGGERCKILLIAWCLSANQVCQFGSL
jgi:hypothetical protein